MEQAAGRVGQAGDDARVRVVAGVAAALRLHVEHPDVRGRTDQPGLRSTAQAMLPRVDLPEVLLDVNASEAPPGDPVADSGTATRPPGAASDGSRDSRSGMLQRDNLVARRGERLSAGLPGACRGWGCGGAESVAAARRSGLCW